MRRWAGLSLVIVASASAGAAGAQGADVRAGLSYLPALYADKRDVIPETVGRYDDLTPGRQRLLDDLERPVAKAVRAELGAGGRT